MSQERMKRLFIIFTVVGLIAPSVCNGAVTVHKKAAVTKKAAVETQQAGGMASAAGILSMIVPTVQSVLELKKQTQELSADCMPNSGDVSTVNRLVKEWAKIGDTSAIKAHKSISTKQCKDNDYEKQMKTDPQKECVVIFDDKSSCGKGDSRGTYYEFKFDMDCSKDDYACGYKNVWCGYPQAKAVKVDKKNYSNVYDVFSKIPFVPEDYTKDEISAVSKLIEKSERCAPGKLSQKKRELWGNFLTKTISSVGTSAGVSGIGDVMQMATQFSGSGGVSSVLNNFGTMVPSMLDK